MSVMLTFGIALGSLGYKQQILASSAVESQNAFYAADSALECLLYADQKLNLFAHQIPQQNPTPVLTCDGTSAVSVNVDSWNANQWVLSERVSIDSGRLCADVTIYKPAANSGLTTFLFSRGYNVSCATVDNPGNARFTVRGLNASYQ